MARARHRDRVPVVKLTVNAGELAAIMRRAALTADERTGALAAVRLSAANGQLRAYCTTLDRGVAASAPCTIVEPGSTAPRANAMRALAAGFDPAANVEIEAA